MPREKARLVIGRMRLGVTLSGIGDHVAFDPAELAAESGVAVASARRFLETFHIPFGSLGHGLCTP